MAITAEFSIFHAYRDDDSNNNNDRAEEKEERKIAQYFAYLAICHKYPDDIYVNDLHIINQAATFNVYILKISINLSFALLKLSIFILKLMRIVSQQLTNSHTHS